MTSQNSIDELDEPLRTAVLEMRSESLSESSAGRLLATACHLPESESHSGKEPNHRKNSKKRLYSKVLALVVTAAALLAMFTMWPRQTHAWEQVLAAVAKQPWLLMGNAEQGRTWYCKDPKTIVGRSNLPAMGEVCVFMDLENNTIDNFIDKVPPGSAPLNREPGKIYRSAIRKDNRRGIDSAVRRYEAALLGQTNGMMLDSYKVASQNQAEITKDGKRFLEYRFKLERVKEHHPQEIVITVDPQSKLPVEKQVKTAAGDKIVIPISFPNTGPSSIFELGVPVDTELVDTRPNESAQKILDALRKGRTEMDPYFAVTTEGYDLIPRPQRVSEHVVWRKGTRWRVGETRIFELQNPNPEPDVSDPVAWWHAFVENADTRVRVISDGTTECTYRPVWPKVDTPDPNNPTFQLIEGYREEMRRHRDPSDPDAYYPEELAEWIGYPKLVYDANFEIDKDPQEGPEDTILFTMTYTDRIERLWLDPDRNYLALRHDYGEHSGTTEVLDTVRTPSGKWLPSVVRTSVPTPNGKEKEQVRHRNFFYRFDVEIDDSKFTISDL